MDSELVQKITIIMVTITAFATMIYTIGTFLLWWTTQKTLNLTKKQAELNEAIYRANLQNSVIDSHRQLMMSVIQDDELGKIFADSMNVSIDILKKRYLASLKINHSLMLFYQHHYGLIDENRWQSISGDMRESFNLSFISERWKTMKNFAPKEFVDFIENTINESHV